MSASIRLCFGLLLLAAFALSGPGCLPCDGDGDGFCAPEDCDETDRNRNPDAEERCNQIDDDCSGGLPSDELTDNDNDGVVRCLDCNDNDPDVFPGAAERCNGLDDDCDGEPNRDESDEDGDGFRGCEDCTDDDPLSYPGAEEQCDGEDTDCDGIVPPDEEEFDNDGFWECEGDCDPEDPFVYPGADEICDGKDSDCDGEMPAEESIDQDGDFHPVCADCDDTVHGISPDAPEICDGIDTNCDGEVLQDEFGEGIEKDEDEDGVLVCDGDCDDTDPEISPRAYAILDDGINNDCFDGPKAQPGWGPFADPPDFLTDWVIDQCEWHLATAATADFETGAPGATVGSSIPGVTMQGALAGAPVPLAFVDTAADATPPYAGTRFGTTSSAADALTFQFEAPQTMVAFAVAIENPSQYFDYSGVISWQGTELINGPLYGSEAPGAGWAFRGILSLNNIAFDSFTIETPGAGEIIHVDDLWFCR